MQWYGCVIDIKLSELHDYNYIKFQDLWHSSLVSWIRVGEDGVTGSRIELGDSENTWLLILKHAIILWVSVWVCVGRKGNRGGHAMHTCADQRIAVWTWLFCSTFTWGVALFARLVTLSHLAGPQCLAMWLYSPCGNPASFTLLICRLSCVSAMS